MKNSTNNKNQVKKSQVKTVKTPFGYSVKVGGFKNVGTKTNK